MTKPTTTVTDAARIAYEDWFHVAISNGQISWAHDDQFRLCWQAATRVALEQQAAEIEALKADNASMLDSLTKESTARCEAEDRIAALEAQLAKINKEQP